MKNKKGKKRQREKIIKRKKIFLKKNRIKIEILRIQKLERK